MADQKVSDLTSVASVNGDEIMYLVDDPSGTPLDRKVAADTLLARAASAMSAGSLALSKLATDPLARANHTGTQLVSGLATSTLTTSDG